MTDDNPIQQITYEAPGDGTLRTIITYADGTTTVTEDKLPTEEPQQ